MLFDKLSELALLLTELTLILLDLLLVLRALNLAFERSYLALHSTLLFFKLSLFPYLLGRNRLWYLCKPLYVLPHSMTTVRVEQPASYCHRQQHRVALVTASVSIHALAKRATSNLYNDYLYFEAKYHISDIFPL